MPVDFTYLKTLTLFKARHRQRVAPRIIRAKEKKFVVVYCVKLVRDIPTETYCAAERVTPHEKITAITEQNIKS